MAGDATLPGPFSSLRLKLCQALSKTASGRVTITTLRHMRTQVVSVWHARHTSVLAQADMRGRQCARCDTSGVEHVAPCHRPCLSAHLRHSAPSMLVQHG
eukprot:15479172-Alexandrium_andersonii.AAC.1